MNSHFFKSLETKLQIKIGSTSHFVNQYQRSVPVLILIHGNDSHVWGSPPFTG